VKRTEESKNFRIEEKKSKRIENERVEESKKGTGREYKSQRTLE